MDNITECKAAASNFITGPVCSKNVHNRILLELKNCSKRNPGFERCQCLQAMNESNVERVKVKYTKIGSFRAARLKVPPNMQNLKF